MVDIINISKIRTNTGDHEIDAKYWNGHATSDLKTINGKPILAKGGGNIQITADDLGLLSALKYCGITTTPLYDGSSENPVEIGGKDHFATAGCVVFYNENAGSDGDNDMSFVFNGSYWELLGEETTEISKKIYKIENESIPSLNKKINDEILRAKGVEAQKADSSYVYDNFVPRTVEDYDNCEANIDINVVNVHPANFSDIYATSSIQLGMDNVGSMIKLSAYDGDDLNKPYESSLTISAFDGVKVNGSKVLTEHNIGSTNVVTVDNNNVSNKSEITIGTFEIKNVQEYNYTLEGHFRPYDWSGYGLNEHDVNDCMFTAEYNHEGVKLGFSNDEECWIYEFVVTEAKINVNLYEGEGETEWRDFNDFVGHTFPIESAYLDTDYAQDDITPLIFTDDVADSPTLYFNYNEDYVYDAKFIRTAPLSLKHTSKALLNGVPVATVDMIPDAVTVDSALSTTSVNPVQNKVITNAIANSVHFAGFINSENVPELSEEYGNTVYGEWVDFHGEFDGKHFREGDIIILVYNDNEDGFYSEPTKEYILVNDNDGLKWVEFGKQNLNLYRLEYTASESLEDINPCNITYAYHEYNYKTGKGVFIYDAEPTSIGGDAFYGCTSLTSVTIPDSVTKIGERAFFGCDGLTSITFPNSVTSIGNYVFGDCSGLTSITIPDGVNMIGSETFSYCTSLKSITIGKGITSIGVDAFYKCVTLEDIYCKALNPPEMEYDNYLDRVKIHVPINSLDEYKDATNWSDYADNIIGSEILSLSDDSLMSVSISLEERIKHLENIIEQIVITK